MYGLPDTLRPLSAAEEQVMLAVWACPGAAARRDISQKLKATGWAAATVLNFLYRLEEKGWVRSVRNSFVLGGRGEDMRYFCSPNQKTVLRTRRIVELRSGPKNAKVAKEIPYSGVRSRR